MTREKAKEKATSLVGKMTLEEKVLQLGVVAPEIQRLNVPKYVYWSEALHGVARGGVATVFPQAIGLAAMFDPEMMGRIGETIAMEARAKYNAAQEFGDADVYKGLTLWSPNVNIFRDPRWGRGHETFGEDPYLTGSTAVPLIKGMQGDDKYLKTAACAKHYAVHSGPEDGRLLLDAKVNEKDLHETYLPAFKACVTEADVESIMTALNFVNGIPATLNKELFDILRHDWQFEGHITSDFLGLENLTMEQHYTKDQPEGIAAGVNAGVDLVNGVMAKALYQALEREIITEEKISEAAINLFTTRYRLGMFADDCSFDDIEYDEIESPKHQQIAYDAALKSCVLLKNDQLLPLDKKKVKKIAVIGPNANSRVALEGNYQGTASRYTTVLEGIQDEVGAAAKVYYAQGCHLYKTKVEEVANEDDRLSEALKVALLSEVVILSLGLDATLEGENGDAGNAYGAGDKETLELPGLQQHLMDEILKLNKPTILLINAGSALTFNGAEENPNLKAIMVNWYPGTQGGHAVADILFGKVSPSGKLPITFYKTTEELPDISDYAMKNRTYRYMEKPALFPFGYGLTYSTVALSEAQFNDNQVKVKIKNTGTYEVDEVVQVYAKHLTSDLEVLNSRLVGYKRVKLPIGDCQEVMIELDENTFTLVDHEGKRKAVSGDYQLFVSISQPDQQSQKLTGVLPQIIKVVK